MDTNVLKTFIAVCEYSGFSAAAEKLGYTQSTVSSQIRQLEKELLEQNAQHKDWACTEELMKTTKDGNALYLHCLPADITGVSC